LLFTADCHTSRSVHFLGLEASGEAAAIYDAWFGPKSDSPLPRSFRIQRE